MPRIPLDHKLTKLIVLLSELDYIVTTYSCQGHGKGEKQCNICIKIPASHEKRLKLFNFLIDLMKRCVHINIRISPAKNLSVYFRYSRENTFKKVVGKIERLIKTNIKKEESLELRRVSGNNRKR